MARRAYAQALAKIAGLRQCLDETRRHIDLIESKLQEPEPPLTEKLLRALFYLKLNLDRAASVRGVRRPSAPPQPPEELGAVATVCTCRSWLRNVAEVHQHWETGCFDQHEYEAPQACLPQDPDDESDEVKEMISE